MKKERCSRDSSTRRFIKVPLSYQMTEFDCATVSLINAFSYLFNREELPTILLKKIMDYTLDCYNEDGILGHGGTSRKAIEDFVIWITEYSKTNKFKVDCKYLERNEVTFDKIYECLKNNGDCYVRSWLKEEHYIIITKINKRYAYIFDPYYLDKFIYKDKDVKIILNKPFKFNRRVTIKRLFSESEQDFSLGKISGRQCILIKKRE